ncbi:alkaline phosphatase family protein [Halorientalis brevis]|uniref:Alkaline phosphatase family protein n=1 Tax=Halorientalis brevis TaxID=1126241 RepID=A0ABD6CEQ7_9EURY|nr:alkaline phosphatase family protein [Halorientalis brevis]
MSRCSTQTVVLGFDALSRKYLETFDLPNFDSLRERGASASLRSTFPPWTGSAWPSLYTGVDPSHHGVYSFFDFENGYPNEADLISRKDVRAPAIWDYLTDEGVSAVVLNMPVTHPADAIDGAIVPGYLAPEDAVGYPREIRSELTDALGETYRIYATDETGSPDDEMLRSYVDLIDLRRRAARTLLQTREPDVAILQVQKTDTVFHQFDDRTAFRRVYEAADSFLGTILETVDEDANVIVCSDHGIGPTRGYNIYINEILREAGFVEETYDGETPMFGDSKHRLANDTDGEEESSAVATRAMSGLATALGSVGIQPGDVYTIAQRVGVGESLRRLLPAHTDALARHVDWSDSRAYCRSGPELGVRINVEGREPDGVVPPEQYESVRDDVIETLSGVRTPNGEPAFEWVKRREEVYDGPYAGEACDVLFQPAGMNHIVATNLLGKQFISIDKHNHKSDGVFIGAGPAFAAQSDTEQLSLTDVAPMVLALAGCPVPERMTGSIPPSLLTTSHETRPYADLQYGTGTVTTDDDDQVEARLEDLGYL